MAALNTAVSGSKIKIISKNIEHGEHERHQLNDQCHILNLDGMNRP